MSEIIQGMQNETNFDVTATATGPGRLFRNPLYQYLADMPPFSASVDSAVLTDWLNNKSAEGWTLISVNNNGQYIFYMNEVGGRIPERISLSSGSGTT